MYEVSNSIIAIGLLAVFLVFAYLLFHVARWYKTAGDRDEVYALIEIGQLYKVADELDIDVDVLREKLALIQHNKYDFRKRLQQKVVVDVFGELEKK